MSVLYLPPCPVGCSGSLEDVSFNECTPERHWGEISKVYVGPSDLADFLNVSALGEWTTRLADTGDDKIRTLITIGEMPEPEQTEIFTSGNRYAYSPKKYLINFEVDETNETNYLFMVMSACGGKFKIWFETSDGILYGGNSGIEVTLKMNQVIPKEREGLVKFICQAKWQAEFAPYRCTSPMA